MVYQIGLALYDYLILPEMSNDPDVQLWCQKNPLDFDHPYFKTEAGQKMQVLIARMTDANPENRPKLAEVQREMQALAVSPVNKEENEQNKDNAVAAANFKRFKHAFHMQMGDRTLSEDRLLADFTRRLEQSPFPAEVKAQFLALAEKDRDLANSCLQFAEKLQIIVTDNQARVGQEYLSFYRQGATRHGLLSNGIDKAVEELSQGNEDNAKVIIEETITAIKSYHSAQKPELEPLEQVYEEMNNQTGNVMSHTSL